MLARSPSSSVTPRYCYRSFVSLLLLLSLHFSHTQHIVRWLAWSGFVMVDSASLLHLLPLYCFNLLHLLALHLFPYTIVHLLLPSFYISTNTSVFFLGFDSLLRDYFDCCFWFSVWNASHLVDSVKAVVVEGEVVCVHTVDALLFQAQEQ